MTIRLARLALALAAVLVVAPACDDGPVIAPEEFQPVGSWQAVIFTATTGAGVYDLLELGGSISLHLLPNFALAGTYAIPEFEGQPSDELEIAGTWTQLGLSTVRFEHFGDSYVRRLSFIGGGDQMRANGVIGGIDIHIVLER